MKSVMFDLIKEYDCITLFRHISPDADALGSQFGLKQWIHDTYPEKKVYALGFDGGGSKDGYFPSMDVVDDETVQNSLAIILDTANSIRVDDQRFKDAKHSLTIDHHIFVEKIADTEIVEDLAGATCEILASIFKEAKCSISCVCAQYLYGGLIADTLRFSISTTSPETLRVAAYLIEAGVDVAKANEENFSTPLRLFRYENFIRANCTIVEEKLAYIIVRRKDYEGLGLTFNEAKEKVFVMGGVNELESWALFVEKETDKEGNPIFNGSLRSKHNPISNIAKRYHGGGHRFACGVKNLTLDTIDSLLEELLNNVKVG